MKSGFEKLNHIVTPTTPISVISKTIIFVDNIDRARQMAMYLQC